MPWLYCRDSEGELSTDLGYQALLPTTYPDGRKPWRVVPDGLNGIYSIRVE
jgi:hypothetical protein